MKYFWTFITCDKYGDKYFITSYIHPTWVSFIWPLQKKTKRKKLYPIFIPTHFLPSSCNIVIFKCHAYDHSHHSSIITIIHTNKKQQKEITKQFVIHIHEHRHKYIPSPYIHWGPQAIHHVYYHTKLTLNPYSYQYITHHPKSYIHQLIKWNRN